LSRNKCRWEWMTDLAPHSPCCSLMYCSLMYCSIPKARPTSGCPHLLGHSWAQGSRWGFTYLDLGPRP
jgi:hypothetical protein